MGSGVTLDKSDSYSRRMDDYLMHRLDKMETAIEEMREDFADISVKLDKLTEAQEGNQPSIAAMKSVLDAGGMLKWSVSTIVVICAGFAAVMTALEVVQKWFVK